MLAEFTIGRKTCLNPVGAFQSLKPKSPWVGIGYMGVLAGFFILSFYAVVGGWTLAYVVKAFTHTMSNFSSPIEAEQFFDFFAANTWEVLFYHALFMAICVGIVLRGIHGGIERACKVLMPTLVIILIFLMFRRSGKVLLSLIWLGRDSTIQCGTPSRKFVNVTGKKRR